MTVGKQTVDGPHWIQ